MNPTEQLTQTSHDDAWPPLPFEEWEDTCSTLHMWTQIIGKIRLALVPHINHWWQVPLYVSSRGLTTSPMPYDTRTLTIEFNFLKHVLEIRTSTGEEQHIVLAPRSVANFYEEVMIRLQQVGMPVRIWTRPVEIPEPIPFEVDHEHASYDEMYVERFWQVLAQAERVFAQFRSAYMGKVSPIHFFWGAFDLAVTRFSGRRAPLHPGGIPSVADWVMSEAYSHQLSSAGFWPGSQGGDAAFYSYAYPEPEGFVNAPLQPRAAYYHAGLGEFILPYRDMRQQNPDEALLAFLQSSYEAAASLGEWDRAALERAPGQPGREEW